MIWSISDSKTFRRCQRQWFYKSIAGNAKAADPVRHRLYLLSKLQSISAWRGQIVDSVISDVLIPAVISKRRITLDQIKGHARLLFDRQLTCATKHELFSPGFVPSRLGPEFAALHCMDPTVGYAVTLAALGPGGAACAAPAQANACLLDNVLASAITAGTAKSGYYYGVGGVVAGALVLTYTVGSSAAVFNQTGVRNFCSSDDGVIHFESPLGNPLP